MSPVESRARRQTPRMFTNGMDIMTSVSSLTIAAAPWGYGG